MMYRADPTLCVRRSLVDDDASLLAWPGTVAREKGSAGGTRNKARRGLTRILHWSQPEPAGVVGGERGWKLEKVCRQLVWFGPQLSRPGRRTRRVPEKMARSEPKFSIMTLQDRYSGLFLQSWTGYCPVRTFPSLSLSHTHTLFITVQGTTNHTLYSVYVDRVRTYMVPIAILVKWQMESWEHN